MEEILKWNCLIIEKVVLSCACLFGLYLTHVCFSLYSHFHRSPNKQKALKVKINIKLSSPVATNEDCMKKWIQYCKDIRIQIFLMRSGLVFLTVKIPQNGNIDVYY